MSKTRGFSLVECLCALALLAVALVSTMSAYITHVKSERFTSERRLALQGAVAKVDEMRRLVASGWSLDQLYDNYKPFIGVTDTANMPLASFKVPGLTDGVNAVRNEYVGTVSLIVDESPNEADYGVDYTVSPSALRLGADINGNAYYLDTYPAVPAKPFPMDINGNGNTTDNPLVEGFYLLPVVVTVHWTGVFGAQRLDLFTIVFPDKRI
jgi:prepilin-type N-terminal cleavage/methylation domain-containing protein